MDIDLNRILGLFHIGSSQFQPFQLITHMFMHGGFFHIFFNMYALFLFGQALEQVWGSKRFFIYYFITGLGAAFLHNFVQYVQIQSIVSSLSPESVAQVKNEGAALLESGRNYIDVGMGALNRLLHIPTVGASGAVFGVLLAFGMYFPNTVLMLIFPPIPIKAKYFVMIYGAIELWLGITQSNSNVAHFAHLGGMLFGFILIKIWAKRRDTFY